MPSEQLMDTIQGAADKSGLTPDAIRVWERRYQAVVPQRTASNQRLYAPSDIARLTLLKQLTDVGRRISSLAHLSTEALASLLKSEQDNEAKRLEASAVAFDQLSDAFYHSTSAAEPHLTRCLDAVLQLDTQNLDIALQEGLVGLGSVAFLTRLLEPLMQQVGDLWRSGEVRTCQEHFASAHIRSFLGRLMLEASADSKGPRILVATPPDYLHEIGAAMAAVMASLSGWNVIYLGPNVPLEEILFAAESKAVRAVALSITYPCDDPRTPGFLKQLATLLPDSIAVLVGGTSASRYREVLRSVNAEEVGSLEIFSQRLDALRLA